jgi:phosphoglycolate phosphatase
MRIRTVVFDFDGTLLDSKPGIVRCFEAAGAVHDLNTAGIADWIIGPPANESMQRLMPNCSEAERSVFLAEFRKNYALEGWADCSLYPGVVDLLNDLQTSAIKMYLCTSKRNDLSLKLLHHFNLSKYFSAVIADQDNLQSHDKRDLLTQLITGQNIDASSCVMIGDSKYDIQAAHAADTKAIAVLYGYGQRAELLDAGADAYCKSPDEVFAAIRQFG